MKQTLLIAIFFAFAFTSLSAQCFLDRHNTTWFDSWISCTTSANPNSARGESHWILYNLNEPHELYQMHLWNLNAPEYLTAGMQDLVIDISTDGVNWVQVGEFELEMAEGTSTYEGLELYDFGGTTAQYILITGLTNHGGSCFGLSEIRIDVSDGIVNNVEEQSVNPCLSAKIFPNPIHENSKAVISSTCSNAPITYAIQDISGRTITSGLISLVSTETELDLSALQLAAGSYVLSLQQEELVQRFKIVKID